MAHFTAKVLVPHIITPRKGLIQTPDLIAPLSGEFQVTWIGHASFLVQTEGMNLLIDPVWARWLGIVKRVRQPGLHLRKLPKIDLVLITHAHYDHLHKKTLKHVADGQLIVTPKSVGRIVKSCGFGQIREMEAWESVRCGSLEITFTPARHWGARFLGDSHRGFGGYLIRNSAGRTLYHSGDSAWFDGFAEIGQHSGIDLALLPIGAYDNVSGRDVHMNPEQALDAFQELGAAHMVPMHYGTFPLTSEPILEPLERLRAASLSRGLCERITVLPEGMPGKF